MAERKTWLGRLFKSMPSWTPMRSGDAEGKHRSVKQIEMGTAYESDERVHEKGEKYQLFSFGTMGGVIKEKLIVLKRDENGKAIETKSVVGDILGGDRSDFADWRPGGVGAINADRALANFRGIAYAAVNAKAREVMNIDWRLFEVTGKNHKEKQEHDMLDLLDTVNPDLTGAELKYITSSHLDITGNAYWYLEGVKSETDQPTAIHVMDPARVKVLIDKSQWPYQIAGYRLRMENRTYTYKPYEVLHFRLPNPSDPLQGYGVMQAAADYIDTDNYAVEFNRKFFLNGARVAGVLETEYSNEDQLEALKVGWVETHGGIQNMNGVAVLPIGVKWVPTGSSPKDMDFKNLSQDSKERILLMFGVSKTILGTAESDTNRATAETADYVFSKRVIKPHMELISNFLNENLVGRYSDNLYLTFIDPVPEDRAARVEEMKVATGGIPVITAAEARKEFMGLGPVPGSEVLLAPTTMAPAEHAGQAPGADGKPPAKPKPVDAGDITPESGGGADKGLRKCANGWYAADIRVSSTKFRTRAKARQALTEDYADRIKEAVRKAFASPTHKAFTPEQIPAMFKSYQERQQEGEKRISDAIKELNHKQKEEVLANLERAVKAVDPKKLFDMDTWINFTTNLLSPIVEDIYSTEGKDASAALGVEPIDPLTDQTTLAAVQASLAKLAENYNQETMDALETQLNADIQAGVPMVDMSKTISTVYDEWSDGYRADRLAKTESFAAMNGGQKEAWKQSGVVKTVKWVTSGSPCDYCAELEGSIISIDENFLDEGDSIKTDTGNFTAEYGDVGNPPLHPNCNCMAVPEDVSIE